jgi:nitrogen fixation NifU-like protein
MDALENLKKRLQQVYSETTVDHILNPRNAKIIPNPDGHAEVSNSHHESLKVWLTIRNNVIADTGFWTNGCAATIACGSMSTELAKGKTVNDALEISPEDIARALVALPAGNLHCATMAANALRLALMDCITNQKQPWKKLYRK